MKNILAIACLAAVAVGCSEKIPDAVAFGYKGHDLDNPDDKMFFTSSSGITNWVPSRVLTVSEKYDFSADELALIAAAGIVTPSKPLEEIPGDYSEKSEEPWFTTWCRDTTAFGREGKSGFISHFNEKKQIWEIGETYFSSYYDDRESAIAAVNDTEARIAKEFNPKKIHRFDGCFVAEYVRLRVLCIVGQTPDGKWSCMLDIQDKCDAGCGAYVPADVQQHRVDEIAFRAEVEAWRAAVDEKVKVNHEAVAAKAKAAEIPLFGENVKPQPTGDGRMVYVTGGVFPMSNAVAQAVWDAKAKELETASAAKLVPSSSEEYGPCTVWYAMGTNELFTIRLDIAFPKPSTNSEESACGEYRMLCFENLLPGNEPPPPPQRKR